MDTRTANPMSLSGRRVLVTGASSGIGRATAVFAASLGADVVLTGRRGDELERTRGCMERPDAHSAVAGDLSDAAFVDELAARAVAGGRLDGFVHAAGACAVVPVGLASPAMLADSLAVGYGAFMLLMRRLSGRNAANRGFSAVAVSSVSAMAGWPGGSLYAGGKGALNAAVRALAVELAPKGIRVNAVCPSHVRTPLFEALTAGADEASVAALAAKQPLGIGEPEQIASVACFLLSGASSFVTGACIPVDGGYLAQ
ncbi:MAG: SDR family oxidoreductase [Kiritimatiellae bacterium]|nr:SDR family oxidoreductase [Kiritimatiellia bacterium]